ncbi:hypothetical protein [Algibacter pacificus]|uniref:hypothetical protein n=1 Tax=Algibacter pacificus TaxID=2599389 RepID=UPI0011C81EA8|nr:hypothetical protein [Algibacter pacificus]
MSLIVVDYKVSAYQPGKWVVEVNSEHFIVQDNVKILIDILANAKTKQEALIKFNAHFTQELNRVEFESFCKQTLEKVNLVDSEIGTAPAKTKSFLQLEKILFSKKTTDQVVRVFGYLFIPKIFWGAFIILSVASVISIYKIPIIGSTKIPVIWVILLYLPTVLLHEIGHVAACKKFTGQASEIGIGIYIVFPVFFSNISAIWHATKQERIITNLAGVYMQLWCMLVFIMFYLLTGLLLFQHMIFLTGIYNFFQLFPFIRSDGYWLLSDITSTPNLLANSKEILKNSLFPPYKIPITIHWKRVFLFAYGAFNFLLIGYFVYYQFGYNWQEIIEFPSVVWTMLTQVVTLQFSKIDFQYNYMSYIIVYFVLYSYGTKAIKYLYK